MKLKLLLIALLVSFSAFGQEENIIFFNSTGETSHSSKYLTIYLNDKEVSTISVNEYCYQIFNINDPCRIRVDRAGFDPIEVNLMVTNQITVITLILKDDQFSYINKNINQVDDRIIDLCSSKLNIKNAEDCDGLSSIIVQNGNLPKSDVNVTVFKDQDYDCKDFPPSLISDIIEATLSEKYRVVNREDLDILFGEVELILSGLTSETAIEAGEILGAQYLVSYSLSCINNQKILTIKVINMESAEVQFTTVISINFLDDIIKHLTTAFKL